MSDPEKVGTYLRASLCCRRALTAQHYEAIAVAQRGGDVIPRIYFEEIARYYVEEEMAGRPFDDDQESMFQGSTGSPPPTIINGGGGVNTGGGGNMLLQQHQQLPHPMTGAPQEPIPYVLGATQPPVVPSMTVSRGTTPQIHPQTQRSHQEMSSGHSTMGGVGPQQPPPHSGRSSAALGPQVVATPPPHLMPTASNMHQGGPPAGMTGHETHVVPSPVLMTSPGILPGGPVPSSRTRSQPPPPAPKYPSPPTGYGRQQPPPRPPSVMTGGGSVYGGGSMGQMPPPPPPPPPGHMGGPPPPPPGPLHSGGGTRHQTGGMVPSSTSSGAGGGYGPSTNSNGAYGPMGMGGPAPPAGVGHDDGVNGLDP